MSTNTAMVLGLVSPTTTPPRIARNGETGHIRSDIGWANERRCQMVWTPRWQVGDTGQLQPGKDRRGAVHHGLEPEVTATATTWATRPRVLPTTLSKAVRRRR